MGPSETGNLITAVAALGGAIIGGSFSWLANWGSERRQRIFSLHPELSAAEPTDDDACDR
jgi:hypothetical protein